MTRDSIAIVLTIFAHCVPTLSDDSSNVLPTVGSPEHVRAARAARAARLIGIAALIAPYRQLCPVSLVYIGL